MKIEENWEQLFARRDATGLALKARESGRLAGPPLRALADDEILLLGGAREAARFTEKSKETDSPAVVVLTPMKGEAPTEFDLQLAECRAAYPHAEIAGFGPPGWRPRSGAGLNRCVLLLGTVSAGFQLHPNWNAETVGADSDDLTAVLLYGPEACAEALLEAVALLDGHKNLTSVAPLPLGAGDRIPLKGKTTSGNLDMAMLAALRFLLPETVRVRASWAVLGWKVAQVGPAYGAGEMMGWSAAETLAYTGRVRAAARVETAELKAGLQEAGVTRVEWGGKKVGSVS